MQTCVTGSARLHDRNTEKTLCWDIHTTAATRVLMAAPSRCDRYQPAPISPAVRVNLHVVSMLLRICYRCRKFVLRKHRCRRRSCSTSSICGRRRGHPGHLALGMLRGAACGLLLLIGGLTVALAIAIFLPLTLLSSRESPLCL